MDYQSAYEKIGLLRSNLEKVILGKRQVIDLALTTLLARGHLLIEDVPGVGKTTLAHALAKSIDCAFQRIQFTSDLLPSDVLGVTIYNQIEQRFEFRHGPIFANIVLADEINRTTPKTQSALLEAMNDRQVSIDRVTHKLPEPFMLLATQNPLEHSGTFPLPESQLDRFMMSIKIGYPDRDVEREIIMASRETLSPERLNAVLTGNDIAVLQALADKVIVDDDITDYIIAIVAATRTHPEIRLGSSPRGAMVLYKASQAYALVSGRTYSIPDDIKNLTCPVLAHRVISKRYGHDEAQMDRQFIIEEILDKACVPL